MRSRLPLGRLILIPLVALIVVLLAGTAASNRTSSGGTTASAQTVCIDAGHGGNDPGAMYGGLQEKAITLDIAKRLRTLLIADGYKVVMTRTSDVALGNSDRAAICNKGKADTVLSVHLNASTDATADYFTLLFGKAAKDQTFAQVIWDNYRLTGATSEEDLSKSGISPFDSGLLLNANAPAVIAETAFLSSPSEQKLLSKGSGERQQEIAMALRKSLIAWYNRSN